MPRVIVLGCGTGVGKTRVSVALLQELTAANRTCIGLKPIESGVRSRPLSPPSGSDAEALADAGSLRVQVQHPLYALAEPVSPHLAARLSGTEIAAPRVAEWVTAAEQLVTPLVSSGSAIWTVVESAGGVFSPLAVGLTNFELALALEPATWVLVGADSLGVLHDVSATLQAMRARGRQPEHVVLSAARAPDASTGRNAAELSALGIATPSAVLERNNQRGMRELVLRLLASEAEAT